MPEPGTDIALVSNEPTPYRLHVLRRLRGELEDNAAPGDAVRVHNVFTHRLADAHMPWQMQVDDTLRPIFFPELALADRPRDLGRQNRLFEKIRDRLVAERVRLIVLLGYNDLTRLRLIRWARSVGVPLLLTGDSNVFAEGRVNGIKRFVKRRFVRWVVENVAGLMPMGTCGRAFFRLYAPGHTRPTFLFPYEPDYAALSVRDPGAEGDFAQRHGLDPRRKRLLYCGRLVPVKRVGVLIDAFARLAPRRPEWDLVIAGDGPLRGELEAKIAQHDGLASRVKMVGFLQFDDTRACLHACHALVHPSAYEPWAVVINEAVCCGLPVVATEVTGAAVELVRPGTNGYLVEPDSHDALERSLLALTQPGELERLAAGCPGVLEQWRRAADPVCGVRAAVQRLVK